MPFAIEEPEKIPAARYFDEEFYQAELEHLWPRVWQMACRLEQISEVGDWVEYSNVGKSVIVVRTKDGIKAFQNHCRHRGVPIAGGKGNEHGNCAKTGFICPFHGWRWNMDGECTFVYGRHLFSDDLLDKADLALREVRVELWAGCVFINYDKAAKSLRDCLGPMADNFEGRGIDDMRVEWWYATVLPANWKIAMEAFMESYHVMKTHPQLQRAWPAFWNAMFGNETGGIGLPTNPHLGPRENIAMMVSNFEALSDGMGGLLHSKEIEIARSLLDIPLPESNDEAIPYWMERFRAAITETLRESGEANIPDYNEIELTHPINKLEFIFPHYFLLSPYSSCSSYRIRPLGPESCMFEIWSLTHYAEGEEPAPPMEPIVLPYDSQDFPMIPRQDYANIPIQQKGLHSGLEFMRLSKDVEGLISNYQRAIDGFLAGRSQEELATAITRVTGSFDKEIADLGF
ncbi:(2Fe-2S)-binding protein [Novosphingobium pentaromativorans US6-1]|uniref:Rieske domain-containing protein n=1 Tax=Novosphingobium pentaromativorans US6-1 TaxID=1088721 RepID=G6ED42_9SPHN|nr:(2Fe-2S)-binding protein [Novosphingobium pentaromativorans US6-1]EHJ60754.1 hypothetical protein NSU_2263 [Novosphingobium pentaromativorans US6-1]